MPTVKHALLNLRRLYRNCLPDSLPAVEELPEIAADWCAVLPDVTDEELTGAVVAWLRDPVRGRYWPGIADLVARIPGAEAKPPALTDRDEEAWERIQEHTRSTGRYSEGLEGRVAELYDSLDDAQQTALRRLGGLGTLRRADEGTPAEASRARATQRRRFIEAARSFRRVERPALEDGRDRPALEERGLPPIVERFIGGADPHADRRRRLLDAARDEQ